MYWTEEITLMKDEPEKKQGVLVHSYTPVRKVYGERVLLWKGSLYSVQRAYETGSTVELTVSDLPQTKGGPP